MGSHCGVSYIHDHVQGVTENRNVMASNNQVLRQSQRLTSTLFQELQKDKAVAPCRSWS